MKVFLAALLFIGLCVLGFGVNIFFRGKPFPEGEVSRNEDMKRLGIKCMHQIDSEIHDRKLTRKAKTAEGICDGKFDASCENCALYKIEKKQL